MSQCICRKGLRFNFQVLESDVSIMAQVAKGNSCKTINENSQMVTGAAVREKKRKMEEKHKYDNWDRVEFLGS